MPREQTTAREVDPYALFFKKVLTSLVRFFFKKTSLVHHLIVCLQLNWLRIKAWIDAEAKLLRMLALIIQDVKRPNFPAG